MKGAKLIRQYRGEPGPSGKVYVVVTCEDNSPDDESGWVGSTFRTKALAIKECDLGGPPSFVVEITL